MSTPTVFETCSIQVGTSDVATLLQCVSDGHQNVSVCGRNDEKSNKESNAVLSLFDNEFYEYGKIIIVLTLSSFC